MSGSPPDQQIPSLTLLNGYTARLVNQNELNLREAWLRTELFGQRLALVAGRLDLTNYFDHNAVANDETTQFLADATKMKISITPLSGQQVQDLVAKLYAAPRDLVERARTAIKP